MKIRMLKTVILPDGMTAVSGQTLESVPDYMARMFIDDGIAESFEARPDREVIQMRDPVVESRDPSPPMARKQPKRGRFRHA
jgi:hypothetical protein